MQRCAVISDFLVNYVDSPEETGQEGYEEEWKELWKAINDLREWIEVQCSKDC